MKLETDDLYLGAFLLSEGASLDSVTIKGNGGRGVVLFELEGDSLGKLEADYLRGNATANVARFKASINHLKDLMFAKIREERRRDEYQQGRDRESKTLQ